MADPTDEETLPAARLWRSARLASAEYCRLSAVSGGRRLAGHVVLPLEGLPGHIRYRVDVDRAWRTRKVDVAWEAGGESGHLGLMADGAGRWRRDGDPAPELEGCIDVDLGFSPSTNTLPIRRLGLGAGHVATIAAAWVRFPGFDLVAAQQSYERLEERVWRYRSGSFTADLTVGGSGLVLDYGEGLWTAVARHPDNPASSQPRTAS